MIRPFVLFLALGTCALAADIPQGTHVLLRMVNSVSTRSVQEGDYVYLRTASPIDVDGAIVVPVDSYVQGVISRTKRSGRVSGRAELGIRLETLTTTTGKRLKFAPHLNSVDASDSEQSVDRQESIIRQKPERGREAARIAILAGGGASIGGITDRSVRGAGIGAGAGAAVGLATVLLTRGREVELRQGTTLDVVFDRAVSLD